MKRKASKLNWATLERPLLTTDVLWSTSQLEEKCLVYILKSYFFISPMREAKLMMCATVPDEEVVLLAVRYVVSSGSTEAVIQQDMETENRTMGQ